MSSDLLKRCISCDYDIGTQKICPECGRDSTADAPVALARSRIIAGSRRAYVRYAIASAAGLLSLVIGVAVISMELQSNAAPSLWIPVAVCSVIAVGAVLIAPYLVMLVIASQRRVLQYRVWMASAWLVHVPWVSTSLAFALLSGPKVLLSYFAITGNLPPFVIFLGFVAWVVVCWAAVAWWLKSTITALADTGLVATASLRDYAAWALAAISCWGGSAAFGFFIGGVLSSMLHDSPF